MKVLNFTVSDRSLFISLVALAVTPLAWNIVARNEYRNRTLMRFFGGDAYAAACFFAACVCGSGVISHMLYMYALDDQNRAQLFGEPWATIVPGALYAAGAFMLASGIWALGVPGAFFGDCFGILDDARPHRALRAQMYAGHALYVAGAALWYEHAKHLWIAVYVYAVYALALRFEGPFTDEVRADRAAVQMQTPALGPPVAGPSAGSEKAPLLTGKELESGKGTGMEMPYDR